MLSDFTVKKTQNCEEKSLFNWKSISRNEMWCAADNHNYMYFIWAKGFLDTNFNQAFIDKLSNFQEIAPNFTYSHDWNFLDQQLLPYKFYGRDIYM